MGPLSIIHININPQGFKRVLFIYQLDFRMAIYFRLIVEKSKNISNKN